MANPTVQIIIEAIDKTAGVLNNVKSYFGDLQREFSGLVNNPFTDFIRDSIDYTMEFHDNVKKLSTTTGLTIEESSRLISAASDFGVEYKTMMTGIETATKNGREITVEELGEIANKYVELGKTDGPVAQAKYLVDTFGQSGFGMAALFAEGASGVETAMSDVSEALAIDAGEETKLDAYAAAIGEFDSAMGGLKITIATELLPTLTTFFTELNKIIGKFEEFDAKWRIFYASVTTMGGLTLWNADRKENFIVPELKFAEDLSTYEAYRNYVSEILLLANLTADGYGAIRTRTGEAIDGVVILTEEEWNAQRAAEAIGDAIDDIPDASTKTITVRGVIDKSAYEAQAFAGQGSRNPYIGLPGNSRAVGGAVAPNVPYLVGENGPEIFKPNAAGSIIPNGQISDYSGGGEVDYDRMARAFIEALERSSLVR